MRATKSPPTGNLMAGLVFLLLAACCHDAGARDLFTIDASRSSTSDHIDLNRIQYNYSSNRRGHDWPYEEAADSDWDWGIGLDSYSGKAVDTEFTGNRLQAMAGWRYARSGYIAVYGGAHQLDVPALDTQEITSYGVDAHLGITPAIKLGLTASDDYVYQEGLQPAGAREFLNAERWQANIEWGPVDTVRFAASGGAWNLSDANTRRESMVSLMYGISPEWPWVWLGARYENLKYDEARTDYWTPTRFRSLGIALESSFAISANLSGALSAGASRIREDDNPKGNGHYAVIGLDYKLTPRHVLRLGYHRIRSTQEGAAWLEQAYNLSVNGSF